MSFLQQLERKLGWLTFPYLLPVLLAGQFLVYLFYISDQVAFGDLYLVGLPLLQGQQLYRMMTFMVTPISINPFFFLIFLSFTWFIGNTLQNEWGEFRFNLFVFVGWAGTIVVSLLFPVYAFSNFFLFEALMLAFAKLYPNFEIRVFFVIPVKAKVFGYLGWGIIFLALLEDGWRWVAISGAVIPYLLFFGKDHVMELIGRQRAQAFRKKAHVSKSEPFHVCSVCGITDLENPDLEFRYLPGDVCICETCLKEESSE